MIYPLFSIAIATFNSERTLKKTLQSIKNQSYPQSRIEILIIDGGSKDKTLHIAKQFKTKIISNPKTELIYAKQIGFAKARGKYLMYLDSDEALENGDSLKIKYLAFQADPLVKAVVLGGYKTPVGSSGINEYINQFGDPFSFFIYRESKGYKFFVNNFSVKYPVIINNKFFVILNLNKVEFLPLIELWAGGSVIDLNYARKKVPQAKDNPDLIAHLFYLFNKDKKLLAITKNDYTLHYSSDTFLKYLKKINSRIRNNIFATEMGKGGFRGREGFEPSYFKSKKYFFIPYALSIILPLIDSLYLSVRTKRMIFLLHWLLVLYTAIVIIYYSLLKLVGISPKQRFYGN